MSKYEYKILTLVRHGTAPSMAGDTVDYERQLSSEGEQESQTTGKWLHTLGLPLPEYILCSSSTRTQQTLTQLRHGWPQLQSVETNFQKNLYATSHASVIQTLASINSHISHLLLIGHNPYISELATTYTGIYMRMMPANAVVCELQEPHPCWSDALALDNYWKMKYHNTD
ncbi:MAG: hypothetical protein OXT67_08355 [Zetaproteobacteria bacterium]|nr:hypothetical protein [Zetaproteobacteria bacterium]